MEIDDCGNTLIAPKYLKCSGYKNGLTIVQNAYSKWGVIDRYDNVILPFEYDWLSSVDNKIFKAFILGTWIDVDINQKNKVLNLQKNANFINYDRK